MDLILGLNITLHGIDHHELQAVLKETKVIWRRPHRMRAIFLYFTMGKIFPHFSRSRRGASRGTVCHRACDETLATDDLSEN